MSEERFNLVFRGQLAKSVELPTAVRNLAQLFKIDPTRAKALFGGRTTVLKRNLDLATANKYRAAIKKAGAIAELQPAEAPAEEAAPVAETPPAKTAGRAVFDARAPESTRASEQETVKNDPAAKDVEAQPPLPTVEESEEEFTTSAGVFADKRPEPAQVDVPDYGVAPAGEDLLQASERKSVQAAAIDTSSLSLKEGEGNLLNEDEYEDFVPLPADEAAFDLAPAGADVLKPEERRQVEAVEVDISGLSLGSEGENLAPPKPAAPPPPDISNIKLSE